MFGALRRTPRAIGVRFAPCYAQPSAPFRPLALRVVNIAVISSLTHVTQCAPVAL